MGASAIARRIAVLASVLGVLLGALVVGGPAVSAASAVAASTASPAKAKPAIRTWTFGHSVRGRALRVTRIGDAAAPRRILVVGSVHGNEKAGIRIVRRLRTSVPPAGSVYFVVPTLNPDGTAANTRQNARGVDLNRNFPSRWKANGRRGSTYYPGPRWSSEPETRAAIALIREVRPTVTVWYHQHLNLVDPASGPRATARTYGKVANMRVRLLVRYHGSATTWQGVVWPKRSAFVVELPARVSASMLTRHTRAVRVVAQLDP